MQMYYLYVALNALLLCKTSIISYTLIDQIIPAHIKKMSESQTGAGNQKTLKTWKLENFENIKNYPWDMLNNFCFHVYAQKSLFTVENDNDF